VSSTGNIAFKVTWVMGVDGPFTGPCIPEVRAFNVKNRRWCSQRQCECCRAVLKNLSGPVRDESPCNDVAIFGNWEFSAGWYHKGTHKDQPIPLRHAEAGKLAFFTTRQPGQPEKNRIVIGCYRIASIAEYDKEFWVTSEEAGRLRVNDLAKAPRFWHYYHLEDGPRWGSGLFRYLSDRTAERLYTSVERAAGTVASSGRP